ncbi:protein lin-37 homolog isoform X3 [Ornithorhynchus anatinus]|uniref:protein lin-37 homolog isoform X3 n=1 Tax=Ornithorhynchus anatinus TaxID=9258 RepID=UPI0010A839F4|nr:protein lin-37 homolog isoform X3 [Ornithorhynchus anatinus]
MFPVKVKVEKAELEMTKARSHLDAVLQCLLEKSDVDREPLEDETGKTPADAHSKEISPSAAGKRPSARLSHHRRKKRKEMEEGLPEGGQQRSNTYVIKLFDRSVDLAQFGENTPLYPICRAWMRNSPTVREREASPSPPLPLLPEDEETPESDPSMSALIHRNMERWRMVRQRWKEASQRNQLRYADSMKILRDMYERQ